MNDHKGILSIIVRNRFGVLTKVAGLFSRRGYNISAISAGETEDPMITRITVVTEGDDARLRQICSQVQKLEDVLTVRIYSDEGMIERELCLIKVAPDGENLGELMQLVTEFAAKSISVSNVYGQHGHGRGGVIIEASGSSAAIDALVEKAGKFHIVEMSRTGRTVLELNQTALPKV